MVPCQFVAESNTEMISGCFSEVQAFNPLPTDELCPAIKITMQ